MFREDCPCPKTECERHKHCDECRAFHGGKGKPPRCERPPGLLSRLFGGKNDASLALARRIILSGK